LLDSYRNTDDLAVLCLSGEDTQLKSRTDTGILDND